IPSTAPFDRWQEPPSGSQRDQQILLQPVHLLQRSTNITPRINPTVDESALDIPPPIRRQKTRPKPPHAITTLPLTPTTINEPDQAPLLAAANPRRTDKVSAIVRDE
ncbi:hypothetical protein HOY82DRAFT_484696, partial [Tuber indicum]